MEGYILFSWRWSQMQLKPLKLKGIDQFHNVILVSNITKIIAKRMENIVKYQISKEQIGFYRNMHIVEGIVLTQETIHSNR